MAFFHNICTAASLYAATSVLALTPVKQDFSSYDSTSRLRKDLKTQASLIQTKGTASSRHAKIKGNGCNLRLPVDSLPEAGRELKLSAKIKLEAGSGFCRMIFGASKTTWSYYQGCVDLKPEKSPSTSMRGAKALTGVKFKADTWYNIDFLIRPDFAKGGHFDVIINGKKVFANLKLLRDKKQPTQKFMLMFLGKKSNNSADVDDMEVSTGENYKIDPRSIVKVSMPNKPLGGWRFRNNKMKLNLTFEGALSCLTDYEVKLYPNHHNFPEQAEKKPLAIAEINQVNANEEIDLTNVPFGMQTMRVTAKNPAGKTVILFEELVTMLHPLPKQGRDFPPRWAITSHGDRFDRRIDLEIMNVREAGANWTRMEVNWNEIERNGKVDFSHHDKLLEAGNKNGINFFGCILGTPKGAEIVPGSGWGVQPNVERWTEFCRKLMTHYKGKIKFYEVWNEPAHYSWNWFAPGYERPKQYAKLIKAAVKVAREVDPEIKIMGPCATSNMTPYLMNVAQAGGFKHADIISYHLREFPSSKPYFYTQLMKELEPGKKFGLWCTEGANDSKALIASFAGDAPAVGFAYTIRDKGTSRKNYEHFNGMSKYDGLPKDRIVAYQFLVQTFANSNFIGKMYAANGLSAYMFERDGVYSAAVWKRYDKLPGKFIPKEELTRPVKLPAIALKPWIKRYNKLGNPMKSDSVGNKNMVILQGFKADGPSVAEASVNCSSEYEPMDLKQENKLKVSFHNPLKQERTYQLNFIHPESPLKAAKPIKITVPSGKKIVAEVPLYSNQKMPLDAHYYTAELQVDDMKLNKRFGPFWFFSADHLHTLTVDNFAGGFNWCLPKMTGDLHADHSTGVKRKVLDQERLSSGSTVTAAANPVDPKKQAVKLTYHWKKSGKKWGWVARKYSLKKPQLIPGIPLKFSMKIYMENNTNFYPTTILVCFRDPTGKELRVEGGEIYWKGWRKYTVHMPSALTFGRIHSVSGGNNLRIIDKYPLEFTGVILNLVPAKGVINFPDSKASVNGYLMVDDIKIKYYK